MKKKENLPAGKSVFIAVISNDRWYYFIFAPIMIKSNYQMSLRFFVILSTCFILFCCNNSAQNSSEANNDEESIESSILTEAEISKLKYIEFTLDPKAEVLAEPWEPYSRLKTTIENIKKADFSFFVDDNQATFELIKDMRKTIPDTLNNQAVLSRIKIIETMLFKLDEASKFSNITKSELSKIVKDLLIAFSNLNFQINKKLEKDSQQILRPD
ncbi:hypothetical protein [Algibacter sp. 2305UL17-15]|uniref:hypothetical protein n=1 Tax=Algibacter sp. 2305UL17-15 TaxID=3231268 RepID=UPI00345A52AF